MTQGDTKGSSSCSPTIHIHACYYLLGLILIHQLQGSVHEKKQIPNQKQPEPEEQAEEHLPVGRTTAKEHAHYQPVEEVEDRTCSLLDPHD